jgi:hypothetical protein
MVTNLYLGVRSSSLPSNSLMGTNLYLGVRSSSLPSNGLMGTNLYRTAHGPLLSLTVNTPLATFPAAITKARFRALPHSAQCLVLAEADAEN